MKKLLIAYLGLFWIAAAIAVSGYFFHKFFAWLVTKLARPEPVVESPQLDQNLWAYYKQYGTEK